MAALRRVAAVGALALLASLGLALSPPARGQEGPTTCVGDCDGNGTVSIDELLTAVAIALGDLPRDRCIAADRDGNGTVTVDELVAAIAAALDGCPSHALILPPASIYRTFPGFDVELPLGVTDPDESPVHCTASDLPAGAQFDAAAGIFSWTPAADQLGPFYVSFGCVDAQMPPRSADGELIFEVSPLDSCTTPMCDPSSGCTSTLPAPSQPCCAGGPLTRVAEPAAGCPEGRVLFVGQNASANSFGRLYDCDLLQVLNFQQSGAEVQFHIETRCVNALGQVQLHARLESNAAHHAVLFDVETRPFSLSVDPDGFARQRGLRFSVDGVGPYSDLQGAEGNLTVTLTDADDVAVTDRVRVRLTFTPRPDLPDVNPAPTPTREGS
jgi:hypothetical protein